MSEARRELIVYACPTGPLAQQLSTYQIRSKQEIGPNPAHRYMPHCTLTGFFHDQTHSIPLYAAALENSYQYFRSTQPQPVFQIPQILFRPDFHGLILESDWIKQLIQNFAHQVDSPTRSDQLRLKDWLHLSLAYEFPADQHGSLVRLTKEIIDIHASVGWDLCLYERHQDGTWTCHRSWTLEQFA